MTAGEFDFNSLVRSPTATNVASPVCPALIVVALSGICTSRAREDGPSLAHAADRATATASVLAPTPRGEGGRREAAPINSLSL